MHAVPAPFYTVRYDRLDANEFHFFHVVVVTYATLCIFKLFLVLTLTVNATNVSEEARKRARVKIGEGCALCASTLSVVTDDSDSFTNQMHSLTLFQKKYN